MIHQIYLPTGPMAAYVAMYRIITTDAPVVNHLLPGPNMVMAIRRKGSVAFTGDDDVNLSPLVLSGLRKHSKDVRYQDNTENILVVFKPGVAFTSVPSHLLFNHTVDLNDLVPPHQLHMFEDRLGAAQTHQQCIRVIENFLSSCLVMNNTDPVVTAALHEINSSRGNMRIRTLADKLAVSQDVLEKRFRRIVGSSPKQFSFITRMQHIVKTKSFVSLTDLALTAGYYDQSHFVKDFRSFTGTSPSDFFNQSRQW